MGTRKVLVLDTTAFLAGLPLQLHVAKLYTVPDVIEEVKDSESRAALETALELGRVEVAEPPPHTVRRVVRESERIGEHGALSQTDIRVAALALHLKEQGLDVVVVTDDYALQNLVAHLGLKYVPLRTRGIERSRRYQYRCPACGYVSTRYGERRCPVCGTRLVKVVV
jgi:UPF0271 protein